MSRRRIAVALAGVFCSAVVALAVSIAFPPYPVISFESVRDGWRASDAWLLDRNGEPLSRVRVDYQRRRGDWVEKSGLSPSLVDIIIHSEDKRFHSHAGVDWLALVHALEQSAAGNRRGGSTLSMQLAAYLHRDLELGGRRSLIDKWRQLRQAIAIERNWSKDEILEAWVNLTPFRGELEGVDAASRALLRKHASGLNHLESALLAALARSPNASPARVARRACGILGRDEQACLGLQSLAALHLTGRSSFASLEGDAPHLAHKLLKRPGERLISTLDARIQKFAIEALQRHLRELEGHNVEDGAVVVIDNASGDVLAWVGSSGDGLSQADEVDGVLAKRQAGSALKPFLYALVIERRLLTAVSILDDSPLAIPLPNGLYVPQNYNHTFQGQVSLRQALASSLNVPAVRTLNLIGYEAFYRRLKALGFSTLVKDADHYGFALALGGADVTLLQLANAYRALANGGRLDPTRTVLNVDHERKTDVQVIDPAAAFIVNDILADGAARAITFGLSSALATKYVSSVKTGTSKDMRDNWAVGFTDRYTVGVWVGNFSGASMHDVSGVTGAAPIWRDVMDFLHASHYPRPPGAPAGLVQKRITYSGKLEPDRDEWFIAGTETTRIVPVAAAARQPHIKTPENGAIYAIDPDIPRARQRISLSASGEQRGLSFVLGDGHRFPANKPVLWAPQPGIQQVRLVDWAGVEYDRVRFEVRGLPRKTK